MSGTTQGTDVSYVAPKAAVDGPLARVRDGDMVEIDVDEGWNEELERRQGQWAEAKARCKPRRQRQRYLRLYARSVIRMNIGVDSDCLLAN